MVYLHAIAESQLNCTQKWVFLPGHNLTSFWLGFQDAGGCVILWQGLNAARLFLLLYFVNDSLKLNSTHKTAATTWLYCSITQRFILR